MAQLEREAGAQSIDATKLRMEKESMQDLLSYSWDSETWQSPRRTNSVSSVVTPDGDTTPDVVRIMVSGNGLLSNVCQVIYRLVSYVIRVCQMMNVCHMIGVSYKCVMR